MYVEESKQNRDIKNQFYYNIRENIIKKNEVLI